MNRRFYRIVFNARRGLRMAVQETAASAGKSPGTTSGALGAALATVLLASTAAHAQIAGAPNVPGTLRPTVLTAPNGVPLVNIQAPSPAGVSRNVYRQFDVQPNGVILNNSRTSVQTQLGGFVAGNPWLGRGPARVIVNEVNSGNPTLLRGAIEVAGPRTEVIVANPAGITVNGLTFLNTSRATLTTGVPQYDAFGGLASFAVREGSVTLEGLGLDASTTDSATILARAIQVNASLWANQLKVVGGANEVTADGGQATPIEGTGPRPAFLLDMTHRGSMYANRIFMEGTEHGLGVRNAGDGYVGMGEFIMKADGSLENRGTIQARRVAIEASGIDNRGGTIRQTGSSELEVTAPTLSNTNGGVVGTGTPSAGASPAASGGSTSVAGGGGTAPSTMPSVQAGSADAVPALAYVPPAPGYLNARDGILNDAGQILAGGGVAMRVPRIDNTGGTLSLGSLSVAAPSFSNAGGTLRIAGAFNAQVSHFDNTGGTVQAGRMDIASAGDLLNRGGVLASEGAMNLTTVGTIDNRGGALASDGSMNIAAGSLDNSGGQLKSLGAMRMETGVVDNTAGFIGARDMLETNTQAFTNAAGGVVFGQGKVSVKTNGAAYDNRGGQTLAGGDLSIHAGAIDNTASLIRSQGMTKLSAHTVNNAQTNNSTNNNTSSGAEQGIEGRDVDITTGHLNNASGAIRANANASITSSGTLDNTQGLISAVDTLSIADANANANANANATATATATATKTLAVRNTDGTLTANKALNLDAARFSGDGRTTSGGDLRIALTQDVVNNAEVRAHGHLNYETTGHLTNNGKLLAGGALTAGGREVENTASAEMSGASTRVQATGTLTNRGLIDSQGHTVIEAATFLNTGPGRTYGDEVSVQATSVLNEAATIASRGRLELGAGSLENRQGALLFSGADMSIDATSRVVNEASTIESLARVSISTPRLENLNTGFATTETTTTRAVAERYIVLDGQRYRESELGRCHKCASDRSDSGQASLARLEYVIPSARYPFEEGYARQPYAINPALYPAGDPAWKLFKVAEGDTASLMASLRAYNADFMARARRDFRELNVTSTRTTQTEVTNAGVAGRIASAGDMTLGGARVLNDNSRITAGGTLLVPGGSVTNTETQGRRLAVDSGTLRGDSVEYKPYRVRPGYFGTAAHTEIAQNVSTRLGSSAVLENTRSAMNTAPGSAQGVAVGAQAGRTGAVDGQVFEVRAAGPAPGVVRTSAPNTALPDASLFGVRPGGLYVVETDPRFTDHRNWLASDYLLGQLGLDPARVQKRLGDGFYEQRLVREQVAQLTGHRFLQGHASDDEQYLALMNAGVTFARAFQLRPGIALTAEQMARLTSDIVWLVEQSVTLPDGTTTQALVPQVYARLRPGDIDGQGSVLSGEDVGLRLAGELRNSGAVAGRRVVEINAANIRNLEGRLSGDAVGLGAREDLDIIGGTVDAESSLVAQAGHDLNVESTTRGATSTSGASDTSRTSLDRIAGLYVSNPNGVLLAGAGNDVNLVAAVLSNTGQGGHTAIHAARDLHLATVSTSVKQNAIANAGNHLRTRESEEVGSTVSAEGSISMSAGRDATLRAADVRAAQGNLLITAGRDIALEAGRQTSAVDGKTTGTSRGLFSRTTTTGTEQAERDLALGSSLGAGGLAYLDAGRNLQAEGATVSGHEGVLMRADGTLNILEARETFSGVHETSTKKSGFSPSLGGIPLPTSSADRTTTSTRADTASASRITSAEGGVLLEGGRAVNLQGVQAEAKEDLTIRGGDVNIRAATDYTGTGTEHATRSANPGAALGHDPGKGFNARRTDMDALQASALQRSRLVGGNVRIEATGDGENGPDAKGGTLTLAGTTVDTPGTLALEADQIALATQSTRTDTRHESHGRDIAWQKARGQGASDQATHYNLFNAGALAIEANRMQAGLGARDSLQALARQPGMAWIEQLQADPLLQGKVDWETVEEAHQNWRYSQQGLTPEGAAIVTLVVAFFTYGAASGVGAAAGAAVGGTAGTVVAGAVTAGLTALASQAAVSFVNHGGDLGDTLDDLGSSDSVKRLVAAMLTGGVLQGLNMNPTGLATAGGGAQPFMVQLRQNLTAGAARAVIGTAIHGGGLEENLKEGLRAALLDTVAAQGANAIGDMDLDAFTNKVAHAIAGCAVGAARSDAGCGAGALGAAIGEMAAEAYGNQSDTVQFAALMSGIAAAVTGVNAEQINIASQAGANAAANNFLAHDENQARKKAIVACESGDQTACAERDAWNARDRARDDRLRSACNANGASQLCGDWIRFAKAVEATYRTTPDNAALRDELRFGMYSDAAERTQLQRLITGTPHASPMSPQAEAVLGQLAGIALDLTPVVGDIKGFVDAETPFDYTLAAIGALGPAGDAAKLLIREAKALLEAGDAAGAAAKVADAQSAIRATVGAKGSWDRVLNGQLMPKATYELSNGHKYMTDASGRVNKVEGKLSLDMMDRNGYQQCATGKCGAANDEGGHLIAASLGGAGDRINIVPQAATLNRGDWRSMEDEFRAALREGKTVNVSIEVAYPPNGGVRPSEFFVTAVIDGVETTKRFRQ